MQVLYSMRQVAHVVVWVEVHVYSATFLGPRKQTQLEPSMPDKDQVSVEFRSL